MRTHARRDEPRRPVGEASDNTVKARSSLPSAKRIRAASDLVAKLASITGTRIQRKMTVGRADDPDEREADRVAAAVTHDLRSPSPSHGVADRDFVQTHGDQPTIGLEGGDPGDDFESRVRRARSGGAPLDPATRSSMEQAFGSDFSGVRVHTDTTSDSLNRSIQASAFTTGSDIFFRGGEYRPGTTSGQEVLAHELTHVVQQGHAPRPLPDEAPAQRVALSGRSDPSTLRRLISAERFASRTQLKFLGFKRTGKSDDQYDEVTDRLRRYHDRFDDATGDANYEKLAALYRLDAYVSTTWPIAKSDKSSRVKHVRALQQEIEADIEEVTSAMKVTSEITDLLRQNRARFDGVTGVESYEKLTALDQIEAYLTKNWPEGDECDDQLKAVEEEIASEKQEAWPAINSWLLQQERERYREYLALPEDTPASQRIAHLQQTLAILREETPAQAPGRERKFYDEYGDDFRDTLHEMVSDTSLEIDEVLMKSSDTAEWFENPTNVEVKSSEDHLNDLDIVTYGLSVRERGPGRELERVPGTPSRGYVKSTLEERNEGYGQAGIPEREPAYHRRNLAMYELDKVLGSDVIPPTFLVKHKRSISLMLTEVEGQVGVKYSKMDPHAKQMISKLFLLDVVAGQVDRHRFNYILEMQGGVVKAVKGIDNDAAFGQKITPEYLEDLSERRTQWMNERRARSKEDEGDELPGSHKLYKGMLPTQLEEIDQAFARRIIKVADDPNPIREALSDLISEVEIAATIDRLQWLADTLRPILDVRDGPVVIEIDEI